MTLRRPPDDHAELIGFPERCPLTRNLSFLSISR